MPLLVFLNAGFSLTNIAILMALLAVGCARRESGKEGVTAGSLPPGQSPTAEVTTEKPPADLTQRVAREKFTGDLDAMVKRRVIRVLVISDRTNIFFDGVQMRGIMYEMFRFEGRFEQEVEDRQCRCVTGPSAG